MSQQIPYELKGLQKAIRYQQWIIKTIQPYLGKRILELGAGIGNMSQWFKEADHLVLTELDSYLLELLKQRMHAIFPNPEVITFVQHDLTKENLASFNHHNIDTIVSFNVLEHIEDDGAVLKNCVELLRQQRSAEKKRLILFVPAHPFAYGELDKEVGHCRRYHRDRFKKLHEEVAPDTTLLLKPFNFVGLWGWWMNGRILKRNVAGEGIIGFFEKICPAVQIIDHILLTLLRIPLGQSLIAIFELQPTINGICKNE